MESYRSKYGCMPSRCTMPSCEPMTNCEPMPRCERRCIGTYTTKYRIYQNCSYDICKECSCCGCEYDDRQYDGCPMCGTPAKANYMGNPHGNPMNNPMDDSPQSEIFGGFGRRRFGGFGGFGRRRFGFFPFFSFFPFSPFFFRRRWF